MLDIGFSKGRQFHGNRTPANFAHLVESIYSLGDQLTATWVCFVIKGQILNS